ncbi:response regulator [Candidatus Bipolaricaulota bacterium]|nr:response regulator [Candidatus Bipolaricaulota bacterium]
MSAPEILIVEDKSIVAENLRMKLRDFGYSIPRLCTTGEKALDAIKKNSPDLVLMDIVLAGAMDGLEAADRIWSEYKRKLAPNIWTSRVCGFCGFGLAGTFEGSSKNHPLSHESLV